MLFKRTTIALALAAVFLALAPAAPTGAVVPTAPATPHAPVTLAASDPAPGQLAWGRFFASDKILKYHRFDSGDLLIFNMVSAATCSLMPLALATGPGAAIMGLTCSLTSIA